MLIERKDTSAVVISSTLTRDIPGTTEYFIAGDGDKIVHFGEVNDSHQMETGQPTVRVFTDRREWVAALAKLGIDPEAEGVPIDEDPVALSAGYAIDDGASILDSVGEYAKSGQLNGRDYFVHNGDSEWYLFWEGDTYGEYWWISTSLGVDGVGASSVYYVGSADATPPLIGWVSNAGGTPPTLSVISY